MTIKRQLRVLVSLTMLACASSASAQKITTVDQLTAKQALEVLAAPLGPIPGDAIAFATAIEIGTTPFGTSSGGFVFKLDPSTGLLARTATTFGPSFTERALTSGEGKVSVGATFSAATYNKLSDLSLSNLPLGSITSTVPRNALVGTANLDFRSRMLAMSGTVGVTDDLDVGVIVPLVSLHISGSSSFVNGEGNVARLAETDTVYSGIGDIAALAKYRFFKFKGSGLLDPGGMAVIFSMRLPTGNPDNLLGLGVTRSLLGYVISGGTGRVQPHANVGFEYWNNNVGVQTSLSPLSSVKARNQFVYAGGIEVEASPRATLILDFLGQQVLGAGQVGTVAASVPPNAFGISSTQSLVTLGEGISKASVIPGLKVNLKGKLLLSLDALITMKNNGLRPTVIPVVGLNLTM